MKPAEAAAKAIEELNRVLDRTPGHELEVLTAFSEAIGSRLEEIDMRIQELEAEEDDGD